MAALLTVISISCSFVKLSHLYSAVTAIVSFVVWALAVFSLWLAAILLSLTDYRSSLFLTCATAVSLIIAFVIWRRSKIATALLIYSLSFSLPLIMGCLVMYYFDLDFLMVGPHGGIYLFGQASLWLLRSSPYLSELAR